MRATNSLKIISLNLGVAFLFLCVVTTLVFQLLDYLIYRKNRIGRFLEHKIFKILFEITDLKRAKKV